MPHRIKDAMPGIRRIITDHVDRWAAASQASPTGAFLIDDGIRKLFMHLGMEVLVCLNADGVIEVGLGFGA